MNLVNEDFKAGYKHVQRVKRNDAEKNEAIYDDHFSPQAKPRGLNMMQERTNKELESIIIKKFMRVAQQRI